MIERARNFFRTIESSAISIHFKNNGGGSADFRAFERATQKGQERRRYFAAERDHDDVAFMNDFPGVAGSHRGQDRNQNQDRQFLHYLESASALRRF